ncbi:PREDICTED: uncharacterized protein LOC107327086 [Paramuricea clavata]|uniref:PREDICTED: uncharacterized protein LOC107327086 n=1 Tax=Paramuricea clavata TaxID=317549 RepID=A0A7D9JDY3_PARCT|nr:PREDICTED: uncharacterized protein LOC107327086 [Paramuricea clavata]
MASMLGVSEATLRRRLRDCELSTAQRFTRLSDEELDNIVKDIKIEFHNSGYRMIIGLLRAKGLHIPQRRVIECLRRVDIEGVIARTLQLGIIFRRKYHVYGPNALWHIDTNHKLIRWRLVIHGGIDGFSRLIVFLNCHNNNCASTALEEFQSAVGKFGLPSRVRTDQGGENVDIARFMLSHPEQGENRGSHITGRSVHNQRIERLWRDVYYACSFKYHSLFTHMENVGILDVTNEIHMFCLHYIYIPIIRQHLVHFVQGYNNHGLSTEGNKTPTQLWIQGMFNMANSSHRTAREMWEPRTENDMILYGVDWSGPTPSREWGSIEMESVAVTVPEIVLPLSDDTLGQVLEHLQVINPLGETANFGIDLYEQAIEVISRLTA